MHRYSPLPLSLSSKSYSAATQGKVANYQSKLKELAAKLKEKQPAMAVLSQMAEEIKAVKLAAPVSKAGAPSAQLQEAMNTANAITKKLGVHSPEAQVAWEVVEEIAAAGNANALGGKLSEEECLIDMAIEACQALEELNRALDLNKSD